MKGVSFRKGGWNMNASLVINGNQICRLIQRTLNHVDPRLVDHGVRVAFMMGKLCKAEGGYTEK